MTHEQVAKFMELMAAGKVPDDKLSERRVFLHGWNEGIEFCQQQLDKVLGLPADAEASDAR